MRITRSNHAKQDHIESSNLRTKLQKPIILALIPVYENHQNCTRLIFFDGTETIIPRKLDTVLNNFLHQHKQCIRALQNKKQRGRQTSEPFLVNILHPLIRVKMRLEPTGHDAVYGYLNMFAGVFCHIIDDTPTYTHLAVNQDVTFIVYHRKEKILQKYNKARTQLFELIQFVYEAVAFSWETRHHIFTQKECAKLEKVAQRCFPIVTKP